MRQILNNKKFVVLCISLIIIDLLFFATFTYDTGHYFSYLKILNGEVLFSDWDPVRGIIFPLYLKIITDVFGYSQNALLIPMVCFHLLIFFISCYLVILAFPEINWKNKRIMNTIIIIVFIIIALDSLIIGYFHVILTEFIAATIAITSCFISIIFFYKIPKNKKNYVIFYLVFSILTMISWHLKQPYFGAGLFPLLIISFLGLLFNKKRINRLYIMLGNFIVLVSLMFSILLWDKFLPDSGFSGNYERSIYGYIDSMKEENIELIQDSPFNYMKKYAKNYLALSNFFYYDIPERKIISNYSFTQAAQNSWLGLRFNKYGISNLQLPVDYPEEFYLLINKFEQKQYPPKYLSEFFEINSHKSIFLFSFLYFLLPLYFFILLIMVIFFHLHDNWLIISFILSGTSLLNALLHSFMNNPVDRYLFLGYPLLLLTVIITLMKLYIIIKRNIKSKVL